MRTHRLVSFAVIAMFAVAGACASPREHTVSVKIIAFNDLHGNLGPSRYTPADGATPVLVGGIDYLAAYVDYLRNQNPNHIVVAAGDLVGASPLLSSFYHDEPTIDAMNLLGLDISAVGNHEFDKGADELLRKQHGGCFPSGVDTCLDRVPFAGARFQYLAANVDSTATGRTFLPPYVIKNFRGVPVAFVGLGLAGTPSLVSRRGVQGLTFKDEASTVNALIPALHARGVRSIIVLIHQGGVQSPREPGHGASINDCAGLLGDPVQSPIVRVVAHLSDAVDMVISGHTHKSYVCRLPNSVGRSIPVTQADYYGRMLTNIDLNLDRNTGRILDVAASNIVVSHPAADAVGSSLHAYLASPAVQQIRSAVARYAAAVAPLAERPVGRIEAPLTTVPNSSGEDAAGDLVADSELAATEAAPLGGAVIAFVNQGGVRPPGFDAAPARYPHEVTYAEAFAVRPFGNNLVTVTLTTAQIKELLEEEFAGCSGQTLDKILHPSEGLHLEWSASNEPCAKIVNVSLRAGGDAIDTLVDRGAVQHPAKTYRVTVDSYLAEGGDGFIILLQAKDRLVGAPDIDALVGYLSSHSAPPANIPRRIRLP